MKSNFLIFVLLAMLTACQQNPKNNQLVNTKSPVSDSLFSKVDDYLKSYVDSGFTGVALIADKNGIIFHKAYNGKGDKIDTNTAFYIASTRKSFAAQAILQLQEGGMLSVNDSLGKFFKKVPRDKRAITIHHLLTHTSGLDECNCADGEKDIERLLKSVLSVKLKNLVGEKWLYRNENYYLLEIIVAQISGMSFKEYVKENILDPAGMSHTGFWGYEKDIKVTIAPFNDSLKTMPLYRKEFIEGKPVPVLIGGMFSTTKDIYNWTVAIQQGKSLSHSSLDASFLPYKSSIIHDINDTAIYYGYGWIPTITKGKRINVFAAGREDWMMNNRVYLLANGITIVVWSMDKKGPDSDAMATVLTGKLVKIFEKIN